MKGRVIELYVTDGPRYVHGDTVVCPHCDHSHKEHEDFEGESGEGECHACGQAFGWTKHVSVRYLTSTVPSDARADCANSAKTPENVDNGHGKGQES